jgi:hypothetical protein
MQPPGGDPIRDYIQANRDRYTRDAIRGKLIQAGHDTRAIERALQEVWPESPSGPSGARNTAEQVQIGWAILVYLVGFAASIWLVVWVVSGSSGAAWTAFMVVFLVLYVVVGFLMVRWVTRWGPPSDFLAWERTIVGLPLLFAILLGVGFFTTCVAAYRLS